LRLVSDRSTRSSLSFGKMAVIQILRPRQSGA